MTVGYYAPLPPARTGVADYAAALLGALRRYGPVRVNAARADAYLYHIGNNRLHGEIYRRALEQPGVAVLHDAVLHHLLLESPDPRAYIDEFVYNYGEWSRSLAGELWRNCARCAVDPRYFEFAMVRRIAETSRAVVVHNPGAAAIVRAHAPGARIVEIPHLFCAPPPECVSQTLRFRERIGVAPRTFLFGVFGYLRESKRLWTVLRTFDAVRRAGADAALLVAGEFVSRDLERLLEPELARPGILRVGRTPEREFWQFAAAVDACLNLRYPPAGETSGIAIRMMGSGKPVLMTAGAETSRFPENACLRVDAGPAETEMLAAYMLWLAGSPHAAREIGRRAAAHVSEYHSTEAVARHFWEVLAGCRD